MRVAAIGRRAGGRTGSASGAASRGSREDVKTLPAPYGGWNARDPMTAMPPEDAIELDNFIPGTGGVTIREGFAVHATGLGTSVQSLMEYNPPSGTVKMFGATANDIWDVTAAGASSSVVGSLTNGRWQHTMFATSGGNFLVLANGADSVRNYDGTSWTTPSITGVTSSTLINVGVHASRLWFVQSGTLDAWYLPVAAIAGAATKLPLGMFCKLGGYLVAIASWTRDGGAGMDDLWVAITSKGEAVVYSGTDPSSASTWSKVGTFRIPEPVGRRCVVQTGADLGLITNQGVVPFSSILPLAQSGAAKVAATDKISGAFTTAIRGAGTEFGWQLIEYPKARLMFVNVVINELALYHQYVMNTQTGAWCRFKGMNSVCWALKGDELYFGGIDGKVYKYGGVFADLGETINAVSISAYTDLDTIRNKIVKMARPMITGPDGYAPLLALRSDYDLDTVNYEASDGGAEGAIWDEAEWDDEDWAIAVTASANWRTVYAEGSVISVAMALAVTDQVQFNAIDLMFETGGHI